MDMSLAREYAARYHEGQFRKAYNIPYIVHPGKVVEYLKQFGFCDEKTEEIGWLHDTIEDTDLTYKEIKDVFGEYVADGVLYLTRDVPNDEYKRRLMYAPLDVQAVKLMDTLHNVETLWVLSKEGIEKKIIDCNEFYIPLAKRICPPVAEMMQFHLDIYRVMAHYLTPAFG